MKQRASFAFICTLFNDAVSESDFTQSNNWIRM